MSFLGRLLGRRGGSAYSDGIALHEEGRFAEAAEVLRGIVDSAGHDTGHLAEFYLRQSLMREGRRLLDDGDADGALGPLAEAAQRWSTYPDLQYGYGLALARAERWPDVLDAARAALAVNGDYVEARVLEAASLFRLGERALTADSLNALVASGSRIEHPVVRLLAADAPFSPDNLPDDPYVLVDDERSSHREAVLHAVEICRGGSWEEGIERMRELCADNPTYPDFRVKLAAALFQTGRDGEALEEVDRALTLNPRYRTAAHLKALILADQHRFSEARDVIGLPDDLTDPVEGHPGEALFCSYLAAALALLTGRFAEARSQLERWQELTTSFPMAELLRGASIQLATPESDGAGHLERVVHAWPLDDLYRFQLGSLHLADRHLDDLQRLLADWPDPVETDQDPLGRRAYLTILLELARGGVPETDDIPKDRAHQPAWRFVLARIHAAAGRHLESLQILRALANEGVATERLVSLMTAVLLALDAGDDADVPETVPAAVLKNRVCLLHRRERTGKARALLGHHQELHPEDLRWTWLNPTFWLDPIRRWIG